MRRKLDPEDVLNRAGRKRRNEMIEAAHSLLMEKGYASVSIDDIIRVSGGSKSSVYKYFGSKEGILKSAVESLADHMLQEIRVQFPTGGTPRQTLTRLGMLLVDLALSDNAINQHRHAVSHAKAFPDVAKMWYESGPKKTMDGLAKFLEREAAAGRLRIADPLRAALLFAGMIVFHENMRLLVCLPRQKKSELRSMVSEAVEIFLAAYGT